MPSAKHSSHPLTLVFSLLLWVFASASTADQLTLTNGDMLHGKMEAQTDTHIIWLADNFGKLKIDKQRVATINGASLSVSITPVFKNTYKGNLSFTGGFSSGNINREDWDLKPKLNGAMAISATVQTSIMKTTALMARCLRNSTT